MLIREPTWFSSTPDMKYQRYTKEEHDAFHDNAEDFLKLSVKLLVQFELKECSGSPNECRIEPIYISIYAVYVNVVACQR
ncbi:uncharacterized protein Z518_08900 [Rhinocladiella mackenziei CBS 650.93]|uniref:Uncharacterized protein n=1 Tax=Rhinocladiella mackenziei CBS 650.93 TaxID=1442369 RepID=A0A0D2IX36_9EURO|nr:uncharacterized protein Z518_08900 [Rhinocladiella mackenziei CBS 650.93]KIX01175.1 hypothetical protein Z518_08900 [Rhinocladiella mackenziei CBS 650.93]